MWDGVRIEQTESRTKESNVAYDNAKNYCLPTEPEMTIYGRPKVPQKYKKQQ